MRWLAFAVVMTLVVITPLSRIAADGPSSDRAARAELRFLEGMVDHHQIAIDMARDCLQKAKTEGVRNLCQTILDTQTSEMNIMRGWLLSWYQTDYVPQSVKASSMSMMDN